MCQYGVSWRRVPSRPSPAVSSTPPETIQAFHRPVLVITRPERVEETKSPAIIGIVRIPDIVGDSPRANWKNWLKNTVPENIAMPTNSEAAEARVMVLLRNRRSGMIGSLARDSTRTKSRPSATAPPVIAQVCQETHA